MACKKRLLGVVVFCLFYAYKDVILASKDPISGGPAVVGFIIRNQGFESALVLGTK